MGQASGSLGGGWGGSAEVGRLANDTVLVPDLGVHPHGRVAGRTVDTSIFSRRKCL